MEKQNYLPAKCFTDLTVWKKAHKFVLDIYAISREFPKDETYGLTSQIRRSAISIPANIAEGFRKRSKMDKARFMNIAEGSAEECRYYLILAHDLGYCQPTNLHEMLDDVTKLLTSYTKAIRNDNN